MIVPLSALPAGTIVYPDSDGKPMAENTKQSRWIMIFFSNLQAIFAKTADVFVAADLFWYAVQGEPGTRAAPDILVVFGRPKGDRGSYKQWEEEDLPVTVAFEILSPGNDYAEMADKLDFYDSRGVEEYYVYDPDKNKLVIYLRRGEVLRKEHQVDGFVSPRMGIKFVMTQPEMTVYRPNGQPFITLEQADRLVEQAEESAKLLTDAPNWLNRKRARPSPNWSGSSNCSVRKVEKTEKVPLHPDFW